MRPITALRANAAEAIPIERPLACPRGARHRLSPQRWFD